MPTGDHPPREPEVRQTPPLLLLFQARPCLSQKPALFVDGGGWEAAKDMSGNDRGGLIGPPSSPQARVSSEATSIIIVLGYVQPGLVLKAYSHRAPKDPLAISLTGTVNNASETY